MYTDSQHGKQTEEFLDVIEELLFFSRAGTLDQEQGENEAWERAVALLRVYRPATWPTSATTTRTPV
jgi:hypothetical protein